MADCQLSTIHCQLDFGDFLMDFDLLSLHVTDTPGHFHFAISLSRFKTNSIALSFLLVNPADNWSKNASLSFG